MEKLIKVSENVFYTLPGDNDRPVYGIIIKRDKTLVIDGGNSPAHAENLLANLNKLGCGKPDWIALTHWHWDHVFGLSTLNTNTIAHFRTTQKISKISTLKWDDKSLDIRVENGDEIPFCRDNIKLELPVCNDLKIAIPNISFKSYVTLNLVDSFKCNVVHVGGDHSDDSSVIYIPEDKVMFIGDCIYTNIYTKTAHYSADKLLNMLNGILKYDAELYIESHSDEPILKSDILKFASLAEDVVKSADCNKLERAKFPKKSNNNYIQDILDAWDFFLEYE